MTPDDLLAGARSWYDAGYCVVPTHEDGGKRPFGLWKEYQAQRPTWEQLETWLRSGRYTGIGVITGAASGGVELLELEGPAGEAVERFRRIREWAEQSADIGLPQLLDRAIAGCSATSAGGGMHLFVRVDGGPARGNTKLAEVGQRPNRRVVAETRGEGGFVVVAPTPARVKHPAGSAYRLIDGASPANTATVTCEERDLLHLLFTNALNEPDLNPVEPAPAASPSTSNAPGPFDAYREAVTWRDILEPAGWRWLKREADGRDHWVRPGKDPREGGSATSLEDGPLYVFSTNAGLPVDQGMSKAQVFAHLNHGGDLSAASKALAEAGYGDRREIPAWEAQLDPDATEEERQEAAGGWVAEHLPRLDWHALWADDTKEQWIVEPLLSVGRLVAIYSAPKVGKSLLLLEIAAGIASGRGALGSTPPPTRTMYVDFENDPRGDTKTRLQAMGYTPDDLENLVVLSYPTLAALDSEAGGKQLLAAAQHYGCQVVVIDTVSRAIKGEENENDTWLQFYRHTGLRLKQAGMAMIRLDHTGKDETKGQRGGSAKSGDVDAIWQLKRLGDEGVQLILDAARYPITERVIGLRRHVNPLRHQIDQKVAKDARSKGVELLRQANVPKDRTVTVQEAEALIRAAGARVSSGVITKAIIDEYQDADEVPGAWVQ